MDNCKDNIEAISMLLDGELDDAQASELRAHIARCETCQKVYDAFSAISGSIAEEMVEPPEMLAKGIMFKIDLMEKGGKKRFAYGRFTAIAACLALILFGANHFGFLGSSGVTMNARSKDSAAPQEAMEANASSVDTAAAGAEEHGNLLDGFLEEFGNLEMTYVEDNVSAESDEESKVTQFGVSSKPMDNFDGNASVDETDFLLFLNGIISYADEHDPENTDENFAFYSSREEGTKDIPVQLRVYEGKYLVPAQNTETNIFSNAAKKQPEPAVTFADLKSLRALSELFKDAEETDETFETDPNYTVGLFDAEGTLIEKEVSPLLLWIYDGRLYFKTAPEAKLMCASVKPEEFTKFLESFEDRTE